MPKVFSKKIRSSGICEYSWHICST